MIVAMGLRDRVAFFVSYIKQVLYLAVPTFVTQMSTIGIMATDTLVVGKTGVSALASLSLAISVLGPINTFVYAIANPLSVMIAHYRGARESKKVIFVVHQGMYLFSFFSIFLFLLLFFSRFFITSLIGFVDPNTSSDVVNDVSSFLRLMAFSMPPLIFFLLFRAFYEGSARTIPIMLTSVATFFFNIPLAYALVYGVPSWSFRGMGVSGAALANILSFYLRIVILVFYTLWVYRKKLSIFFNFSPLSVSKSFEIIRVGFPLAIGYFMESAILASVAYFLVPLGPYVISGSQTAQNIWVLAYTVPFSLNVSASILVGHLLGRKDYVLIKRFVNISTVISILATLCISVGLFFFRRDIALQYSRDPLFVQYATYFISLVALVLIPDGVQSTYSALSRAHKDTFPSMIIYVVGYVSVIPFSYMFTFGYFGFPKVGPGSFYFGHFISLFLITLALYLRNRYIQTKYNDEAFMAKMIN